MNHSSYALYATAVAGGPAPAGKTSILVIDDDPGISQALVRVFSRYDAVVLQAYHGAHGIWLATTRHPDVVITDLRMPQGQGQDVVEYLKARNDTCQIPIIVLTGLHDGDLERRMRKLGVDEYLTKPARTEDLCNAVRRFVALQEKEDSD